jgi:hypothetical protein
MTFDINEVIVVDLDGEPLGITTLGKEVGNLIYRNLSTIEWLEIAQMVHKNLAVNLTDLQRAELTEIINSPSCRFILAVKDALVNYINSLHD